MIYFIDTRYDVTFFCFCFFVEFLVLIKEVDATSS